MAHAAAPAALPQVIVYRPDPVAHHHGEYVHPDRRVVDGPWPYPFPETTEDSSCFAIFMMISGVHKRGCF